MGFRSTLAMTTVGDLPDWFEAKYGEGLANVARREVKAYDYFANLPQDLQRALTEIGWFTPLTSSRQRYVYVWLHECGGVTRVEITQDDIVFLYAQGWAPIAGNSPDPQIGGETIDHGEYCDTCRAGRPVSDCD